jgi:lactate permease
MTNALARGVAAVAGEAYPLLAPFIGMIGAFMTGSTTNSNALFAAFQRDVALLIDVAPGTLVAAQTAGGNIGNSLAPVVILVGASALGQRDVVGPTLRRVGTSAGVLAAVLVAVVGVLA